MVKQFVRKFVLRYFLTNCLFPIKIKSDWILKYQYQQSYQSMYMAKCSAMKRYGASL